jgi:outer membrane protein assembly factor BamA
MAEEVARFSLMDLGYFKAFIEDPVEITEIPGRKGRYRIVLKAQTGQQYQLKEILFANAKGVDNSTLRSLFRIKDGDLFNRTAIDEGLDRMRKLYGARGYVNFTSVPQTAVDEEDASVAIAIDIDTGPVYRFTSLKFLGVNEADSTKLESVLPLKEGEIFSAELFEQTIRTVESQLSRVGEGHDVRLLPNDKDHTVSIEIRSWPCPFRK